MATASEDIIAQNLTSLKDFAVFYAKSGLSVIPLKPGDKIPLIPWREFQARRAMLEEVEAWWRRWPDANIGVVTGQVSGVFVLDIDRPTGVEPAKPFVKTGDGVHIWLRIPEGEKIPTIGKGIAWRGVPCEVKGEGSYVVAPPSLHPSGVRYTWVGNFSGVWSLCYPSDELMRQIQHVKTANVEPSSSPDDAQWVSRLLQGVQEGERDVSATRLAGYLLAKGIPADVALQILKTWNEKNQPPLPDEDLAKVLKSIGKREGVRSEKAGSGLHIFTPGEREVLINRDVRFLVQSLIPEGTATIITGKKGVGKSTLVENLLYSLSTGQPFLGTFATRKARCLYVLYEDAPHLVFKKLCALGVDFSYVDVAEGRVEMGDPVLEAYDVIVLNGLLHTAHFEGTRDANAYLEMARAMLPYQRLAHDTGQIIIATTHAPKGERETADAVIGSIAIAGNSDVVLAYRRRDDGRRVLSGVSRYVGDIEEMVVVSENGRLEVIGTVQSVAFEDMEARILDALAAGPLHLRGIQEAVGGRRETVLRVVRSLCDEGRIVAVEAGGRGTGKATVYALSQVN